MADITAILTGDAERRRGRAPAAEEQLKNAQESNLAGFLTGLASELANEQKPPEVRRLAGLILKNALDARDETRKADLQQKWLALDAGTRTAIKAQVWNTLGSPTPEIRHTGAQAVAKIAGAEIPAKQWPDLVTGLQIERRERGRARGLTPSDARGAGVHLRGDRRGSPERGGGERHAHRHLLRHAQRGAGCRGAARRDASRFRTRCTSRSRTSSGSTSATTSCR